MAPLILHNVPDDELYVGDDGVQRPYAMVFPQQDGLQGNTRSRRAAAETGSFGKSTRRSRSKTGTPARREDPTIQAADKVFSSWLEGQVSEPASAPTTPQRKASTLSNMVSADDANSSSQTRFVAAQEPTEMTLRGYRSSLQQYAAINHFEELAGRICEDYSRDPPIENRRYKSELRDPAFTRRKALTPEEKAKVNKAEGGEHWVKVTFESAEAADAALYASPQAILGCLVYAEPYQGVAPRDEAIPVATDDGPGEELESRTAFRRSNRRSGRPTSVTSTPRFGSGGLVDSLELSPPRSQTSSRTADTGTLTTASTTVTSATATPVRSTARELSMQSSAADADGVYCRNVPSARKARVRPAELALLPQPSYTERVLNHIPFLKWFGGSMIGNEVPRTEAGEFDWNRASLYWKCIWWMDATFGLFGGEISNDDKDD